MRCNKKACMIVAGVGLVVACVVAMTRKHQQSDAERPTMWDKMRKGIEEMPEVEILEPVENSETANKAKNRA